MRILLFGGFLGSGKTTTMLRVAKYLVYTHQQKVAIIENE
ncbi:MAG: GTP-binding protein, partial [Sporomusa sp.]